VRFAEPDGLGTGGATIPNDPNFGVQWHHRNTASDGPVRADMHSVEAWDIATGSTGVVLAVLDTGLAAGLADFSGRVVAGYDFVNDDADPADDHGHGTAVAGAACATGNNGVRVAGVDWRCRIMPLKVLNSNNTGVYSWWAAGIDWAVAEGADVINLSAGGATSSFTLETAIQDAIAQGVIVVTITHNDGTGTIRFPGRLEACITVGSTGRDDAVTGFSNYGPQIDLVAPGTNIYTLTRTGGVQQWWGTSFSAPLVAGTSSLLRSIDPTLTQEQVRTLLCAGADDQVGDALDEPGFDVHYGHGRLNALATLQLADVRLQAPEVEGGAITLRWSSPSNAVVKTPFVVEAGPAPWVESAGAAGFSATQTTWTTTSTGTLFRVRVRE
jgi:subtilisin family serine protease